MMIKTRVLNSKLDDQFFLVRKAFETAYQKLSKRGKHPEWSLLQTEGGLGLGHRRRVVVRFQRDMQSITKHKINSQ